MRVSSSLQLAQNLAEFEPRIDKARAQVNDPSLTWYAYYSLANVNFLQQLLDKAGLDLKEMAGKRRILDIGCADGEMAFFLESLGHSVCAVDYPATNANQMRGIRALKTQLGSSVEIVEADLDAGLRLPNGDERYGLAIFLGLLYHLKNPFLVLESLSRVADYCVLSTRVARFTAGRATEIHNEPVAYLLDRGEANNDVTNFWIFSEAGLRRIIRLTGWDICSFLRVGNTETSDPVTAEGDERFFCLLRRSAAFTNGKLGQGWFEPETDADWRWSGVSFDAEFPAPVAASSEFDLRFYLTEQHVAHEGAVTLRVSANGQSITAREFRQSGHHRLQVPVGGKLVHDGLVAIHVDVSPRHPTKAPDPRDLGVIVNQIRLVGSGA